MYKVMHDTEEECLDSSGSFGKGQSSSGKTKRAGLVLGSSRRAWSE